MLCCWKDGAHLGEEDLVQLARVPGGTLKGVAAVHEGAFGHA